MKLNSKNMQTGIMTRIIESGLVTGYRELGDVGHCKDVVSFVHYNQSCKFFETRRGFRLQDPHSFVLENTESKDRFRFREDVVILYTKKTDFNLPLFRQRCLEDLGVLTYHDERPALDVNRNPERQRISFNFDEFEGSDEEIYKICAKIVHYVLSGLNNFDLPNLS